MKKDYYLTIFLIVLSLFLLLNFSYAATCSTKNGVTINNQSDWNTAANWNCGIVPGAADDVTISVPVTINFDITVNSLTLGNSAVPGSLTIASGTVTSTNGFTHSGFATSLTVNSGATLSIGGPYNLNGSSTTTNVNGDMDMVGLSVTGASSNSFNVSSTGIVTITADVSVAGSAGFDIATGGQVNITGDISVSGSGDLDVDGSLDVDGDMSVSGSGDVTIDGSVDVSGNVTITSSVAMKGTGTISVGGTLTGSTGSVILPVELTYFSGQHLDNKIILSWETASEINNSHFNIESSLDGIKFNTIARVEGFGNSFQRRKYVYEDFEITFGLQYYRLKQIDFDGSYEYSDVIAIRSNKNNPEYLNVFPNPVSNSERVVYIRFYPKKEKCQYIIYGLHGRMLVSKTLTSLSIGKINEIRIDLASLPANKMVFMVINNGGKLIKEKLFL